jgi:sulfur carrier protein
MARFKKPASTPIQQHMRLILPDRSIRVISHGPAPVETILLGEGINPLEVMVSRDGKLITEDTLVGVDDEIRIIRISHGG